MVSFRNRYSTSSVITKKYKLQKKKLEIVLINLLDLAFLQPIISSRVNVCLRKITKLIKIEKHFELNQGRILWPYFL